MSRARLLLRAAAQRLDVAREDGIALVLALGFIVVLSITTATAMSYTAGAQRISSTSNAGQVAYALAEAGVNNAEAVLNQINNNASSPTLLGCSANGQVSAAPCTDLTLTGAGGTAAYHGMYSVNGNTGIWTITSTGTATNPNGAASIKRTISAVVSITGGGQSNNISVWNYVYSTAPQGSGCEVTISGTNVVVDVPMFITGDLCLNGTNSGVVQNTADGGQLVDLRVVGTVTFGGANSTVGTSTTHLYSGIAQGGCITSGNPTPHTCSTTDHWYVDHADSPVSATAPTTDFTNWYNNASPGPKNGCS